MHFLAKPFQEVLLKNNTEVVAEPRKSFFTHEFRVKAPLLKADEQLCISGSDKYLNEWKTAKPYYCYKTGNWWTIKLDLKKEAFPITYKYGVYNAKEKKFINFENGNNRTLPGN